MTHPNIDLSDYTLISISDAANILGISCKTARNWISSKKFPIHTVRIGGRRMLRSIDLIRYVNQLGDVVQPQNLGVVSKEAQLVTVKKRGRPRKT